MSFIRKHRRATAFLFALTFLAISTKGMCMMPAAADEKADPHACCKKGWQTGLPSCCMDAGTDGAATSVTARVVAPTPALCAAPPMGGTPEGGLSTGPSVADTDSVHSPPTKAILRV